MKKFYAILKCLLGIVALAIVTTGCNKDLKDDVNNLKDRVATLEESVAKLNQAIESGKLITAVTPFAETSTMPGGWNITFSDNTNIPIYNGQKGQQGQQGQQGPQGPTPYIWINSAGNWATNPGAKPVDSDHPKYEIKVDGSSVKAYGTSVRTKNIDGFIGFEEYDAVSGEVKNTVKTTIPFDHKNYITAVVETGESVTFTIDGESYTLAKAAVYPESITVIRDKDYVIKGGAVTFRITVNPSTNKVYEKAAFELDYEVDYAFTRAADPEFIKIKDIQPVTGVKGQYDVTLEWAESLTGFAKDAAIFIVLNFTDVKGNPAQVTSATPVIMNEEYVSIKDENMLIVNDIVMFSDETFTDSVRLSNYHEGYVNTVGFTINPNPVTAPKAVNDPFTRYITSAGDKYKFTVVPVSGSDPAVWPADVYTRVVDVTASATDYGRAAVPAVPAKPEIGQGETPGIPAIPSKTVDKDFKVTVYKVPADGIIYTHDFKDWWIPNKTVDYKLSVALGAELAGSGYAASGWNFSIKSQTLTKNGAAVAMTGNITADETRFDATNNFTTSYKLLPTIDAGSYSVEFVVTAASKTPRPAELKQSRDIKIVMTFRIVAPTFQISINDPLHTIIPQNSDTYKTYKLANVAITDLFDVESTKNLSKATDLVPNTAPLGYDFDLTDPRHGAQGVRFNPYPEVTAPAIADWGVQKFIRKPVAVIVRLDTGQEIPVQIVCGNAPSCIHAAGTIYVQYDRLELDHVNAANDAFTGNYNSMILAGRNIAVNHNFTPLSTDGIKLDPTIIKSAGGIVFSEVGTVQCKGGELPSGLAGKKIMSIDPSTGLVKSIDGMTWENPDAVLYQTFRVTYTDIWGNSAYRDVNVYVKSNSVPVI